MLESVPIRLYPFIAHSKNLCDKFSRGDQWISPGGEIGFSVYLLDQIVKDCVYEL